MYIYIYIYMYIHVDNVFCTQMVRSIRREAPHCALQEHTLRRSLPDLLGFHTATPARALQHTQLTAALLLRTSPIQQPRMFPAENQQLMNTELHENCSNRADSHT